MQNSQDGELACLTSTLASAGLQVASSSTRPSQRGERISEIVWCLRSKRRSSRSSRPPSGWTRKRSIWLLKGCSIYAIELGIQRQKYVCPFYSLNKVLTSSDPGHHQPRVSCEILQECRREVLQLLRKCRGHARAQVPQDMGRSRQAGRPRSMASDHTTLL